MDSLWVGMATALWLGIWTSVSPCPLATNIAAISYIGKRVDNPRMVLASGLLYMSGRMLAYWVIALLLIAGVSSIPVAANFLQDNFNVLLGPALIAVGLLLLEIIPFPWRGKGVSEGLKERVDRLGMWGAFLLGVLFALSFCPVSAALFFGSLIPLGIAHDSTVAVPLLFGLGTSLPVAVFAVILAFATNRLSAAFNALTMAERWMRRIAAVVFISVGIYYTCMLTLGWI